MFTEYLGKLLGMAIALSILFAGVVAIIVGINGIIGMESIMSWAVSMFLTSAGFTTTIVGGFGLAIVGPQL